LLNVPVDADSNVSEAVKAKSVGTQEQVKSKQVIEDLMPMASFCILSLYSLDFQCGDSILSQQAGL
jgi:hypothetical protein